MHRYDPGTGLDDTLGTLTDLVRAPSTWLVSAVVEARWTARAGLFASIGEGRFADEVAIVANLGQPLAIPQGDGEQLVSLGYLRKQAIPAPWRGEVQVIPGAGHAPHRETPEQFAALLTAFSSDVRR